MLAAPLLCNNPLKAQCCQSKGHLLKERISKQIWSKDESTTYVFISALERKK
jgi:hypothetical protein